MLQYTALRLLRYQRCYKIHYRDDCVWCGDMYSRPIELLESIGCGTPTRAYSCLRQTWKDIDRNVGECCEWEYCRGVGQSAQCSPVAWVDPQPLSLPTLCLLYGKEKKIRFTKGKVDRCKFPINLDHNAFIVWK